NDIGGPICGHFGRLVWSGPRAVPRLCLPESQELRPTDLGVPACGGCRPGSSETGTQIENERIAPRNTLGPVVREHERHRRLIGFLVAGIAATLLVALPPLAIPVGQAHSP